MRRFPVVLLLLTALLLALSALEGCRTFTSNPGTTLTIANHSSAEIAQVEVAYPGGNMGAPSIAAGKSFSKWVPTKGCKLKIKFLDSANKEHSGTEMDLGEKCPKAVTIDVAADYTATARPTQ